MNLMKASDGPEAMEASDKAGAPIPFGLFELDSAGIVTHFSPRKTEGVSVKKENVLGRNFFDDLLTVEEASDLKSRFHTFMAEGSSVERFTVNFPFIGSSIKVQIVMAHITEHSESGRKQFALVRLTPET
ncbi:MAG: PAS domain-containing protein [Acidobacteriota bacterium]|nr:PAS domain-containing protein [Acidobacteriota bacterium]